MPKQLMLIAVLLACCWDCTAQEVFLGCKWNVYVPELNGSVEVWRPCPSTPTTLPWPTTTLPGATTTTTIVAPTTTTTTIPGQGPEITRIDPEWVPRGSDTMDFMVYGNRITNSSWFYLIETTWGIEHRLVVNYLNVSSYPGDSWVNLWLSGTYLMRSQVYEVVVWNPPGTEYPGWSNRVLFEVR